MRKVFLAEATAYDPVDKKLVTVRMCSRGHGHIAFPDHPDAQYIPCIITPPQQSVSLSENGIPGEIQVEYGNLGISFDRQLRNTHWRRYDFDGYPIKTTPPFQRSRPKNSKRAKPRPDKSLVVAAE